ncbi:MAG: right-handed parallel beta-helix repeat-containing protein, partial [Candidatus Bilamarchaeaceae archaeon]
LNNTVENNEFYNSTFIVVINNSHYNNIANNLIYDSSQDCVALMYGSENNTLANNIIRDCGYHGVELNYEAARTIIFNNTIYSTTANGIDITKSRSNIISNNNITNSSVAISLDRVNNSRIDKNVVFNNRNAGFIVTFLSFYNIVSNNTIQNSSVGIFVDGYAFNNNLTNNTISESNVTAVALVDQNNTIIRNDHYHNNTLDLFVNNSLTYSTVFTLIDVKFDNPFGDSSLRNYSLISLSDALAENESYYINWSDKPTGTLPTDYTFFGKSIIIGNLSDVSINSITLKWDASEEGGYTPARFELWKNNGSEWVYKVPSQAVSPNARTITINNLNNFSAFSILQAPSPPPIPGGGGGGCSRYVDIIYTTDCANDIITIKLVWKLTGEPLKNAAVELISREIGTVYLTTNASGEVSYKVPIALETMDYTIEFRETGSYCAATKEFQYNSCPIGCRDSSECADNEYCEKESGKQFGVCKPVKCDCGEVRDHECYNYDCCSDSQCAPNEYCDISGHVCKEKPKCIGDDCCASDEFYNKNTSACEKIKKGKCGYIQDHKWYDYECCDDSDCKGDYQIITKKEGFIGDMHKFIITGPYCEQHTCRIGPLANRNVSVEDPLGKKIAVETSATGDGQFLLENAGEYIVTFITQQKIGANATVVSIKEEKPVTQPYIALLDQVKNCWWLLLLLLLVIVIGYIIYKRKVGEKYKFRR